MLSEVTVWSPIKDLFTKKIENLWRDYKYHPHFQVTEFETGEEMEENRSKGVS